MEESHLRLEDALFLLERERPARAVSAAYYAFHAAAEGLLLSEGVAITSHAGLRNRLGLHFIRRDRLPVDLARALYRLEEDRADADYDLRSFRKKKAQSRLDEVEEYLSQMELLL